VASHRERLLEGMAYAAARHGYGRTSVARVVERAGVSRATFYEHFRDREECFLAAYRERVRRTREEVCEAARRACPAKRPAAVLGALLDGIAADPAVARVVLIEALAAPPEVRVEHERLIADLEASVERYLDANAAPALQIPAGALLGGVAGILSMRLLSGEAAPSARLLQELLVWIDSYALAPGERRWTAEAWEQLGRGASHFASAPGSRNPAPPSHGRSGAGPAAARHERILAATAQVSVAKGYSSLTVADIVAAAGVTRAAFYSHFRSKEDAFLAVQTVGLQESIAAAAAEFFVGSSWPERVWGGLAALLTYIAENPDLAHLNIVEIQAVGEAALLREQDNRAAYALFLEDGYRHRPEAGQLPRICSEAVAGGIHGLMRRQVSDRKTTRMLEILPQCAYVALAPFTGPTWAMEFVEAKSQAAPSGARRERRPVLGPLGRG
jgi:AcrR family transcriptional regulator